MVSSQKLLGILKLPYKVVVFVQQPSYTIAFLARACYAAFNPPPPLSIQVYVVYHEQVILSIFHNILCIDVLKTFSHACPTYPSNNLDFNNVEHTICPYLYRPATSKRSAQCFSTTSRVYPLSSVVFPTSCASRYSQRMGVALQEVELSKSRDDEHVHFGDVLQLVHLETGFVLSCDVGDVDPRPGELACSATAATQVTAPCARNSLILVRYEPAPGAPLEPDYPDDTLRYGQKVHLAVHPSALGESDVDSAAGPRPLRLFSKPVTTTHYAKYSRKQLVGFTHRNSYDTGKLMQAALSCLPSIL